MTKAIRTIKFDETLTLSECSDGFWVYDSSRGMNLSMKCSSSEIALFEAIKYYQKRLLYIEKKYNNLEDKVYMFLNSGNDSEINND